MWVRLGAQVVLSIPLGGAHLWLLSGDVSLNLSGLTVQRWPTAIAGYECWMVIDLALGTAASCGVGLWTR